MRPPFSKRDTHASFLPLRHASTQLCQWFVCGYSTGFSSTGLPSWNTRLHAPSIGNHIVPFSPTRITPPSPRTTFLPCSPPSQPSGRPIDLKSGNWPPSNHFSVRPSFEVIEHGAYFITTDSLSGNWSLDGLTGWQIADTGEPRSSS